MHVSGAAWAAMRLPNALAVTKVEVEVKGKMLRMDTMSLPSASTASAEAKRILMARFPGISTA